MKTGPKYKVCRRVGDSVYAKCETPKFQLAKARKGFSPKRRRPRTEYGEQLIEKQKIRFTYNVSEKQMSNYVKAAQIGQVGTPHEKLYDLLETRLDNVIYRAGFVNSRQFSRQVVSHGHILVNGKKVRVPSYQVKVDDVLTIRGGSKDNGIFNKLLDKKDQEKAPSWISLDNKKMEIKISGRPSFLDRREGTLDFSTVIEFYNRV